jgi:hypothetical protein
VGARALTDVETASALEPTLFSAFTRNRYVVPYAKRRTVVEVACRTFLDG